MKYEEINKKRQELGKTLEELAVHTKIKKCYLQAIEEGRFDELPIEVYAKSYIKTYAETLGINADPILNEYEEYLKSKKQSAQRIETVSSVESSENKRFYFLKNLPGWVHVAGIIFVVIVLIIVLYQFGKKEEKIPSPPAQHVTEEIKQIEEKTETSAHNPPQQQKLQIEATDKVWMRITIDDEKTKEFLFEPGQKIELKAQKSFKLHIGNAGGVKISFNSRELGKLGNPGQVVYLQLPQDKN